MTTTRQLHRALTVGSQSSGLQSSSVLGFYCNLMKAHPSGFCNKCDDAAQFGLIQALLSNLDNVTIFVTGTYDGSDIRRLTQQRWYVAQRARIYGWEIQREVYDHAVSQLKGHREVQLIHGGVSDKAGRMGLAGTWETAHLREDVNATSSIDVVRWADFVASRGIASVDYALIDTEGNDPRVLRGMDLASRRFPLIQYEIGPQWVSSPSGGTPSLAAAASQVEIAEWLTDLGYELFIMGRRQVDRRNRSTSAPILLPVTPASFRDSWCKFTRWHMLRNNSMQGNVLAAHGEHLRLHAWLAPRVQEMVPAL